MLLANGAPAESYRDDGNRWLFRNANTGWDQPPKPPCAPVLTGGPMVDAVWRRLLDRAGPRPGLPLTDDPDLHLLVDGAAAGCSVTARRGAQLPPAAPGRARCAWCRVPARRRSWVWHATRACSAWRCGGSRCARERGCQVIEAADERLTEGFHGFEAGNGLRWTDGDAAIAGGAVRGLRRTNGIGAACRRHDTVPTVWGGKSSRRRRVART